MCVSDNKVYLVSFVDWNDETTLVGVFSSSGKASDCVKSLDIPFKLFIEEFDLDKIYNF